MIFAWQGWRLEMPRHWSPLRLEGGYDQGYALIADMHRPRVGLRWQRAGRRLNTAAWTAKTMIAEVGALAAAEAQDAAPPDASLWKDGRLYVEPKPPGRDVWLGLSTISQRTVQLIYHAHRRDRILTQRLLPTLVDQPAGQSDWSIFDLSCHAPPGLRLTGQRLNAGDLSLTFGDGRRTQATVRQIALASLALKRQPLERWLAEQVALRRKQYRAVGKAKTDAPTGLLCQISRRRHRRSWQWWISPQFVTLARYDQPRDRLVLIDATSEELAMQMLQSVAWADGCTGGETDDAEN